MKGNNKGFIAISLIYSFFLVFLITLLAIVSNYAQNRILLNDVKKETQGYLNELASFNPVYLKSKKNDAGDNIKYDPFDEVKFGSDVWQVIEEDNEGNVTLLLKRNLSKTEIETSLSKVKSFVSDVANTNAIHEENKEETLMCFNSYSAHVCSYGNSTAYNEYFWENSIVKKIVDEWFYNDKILQKAISPSIGSLQKMSYTDEVKNYTDSYIRIPLSSEFNTIKDENTWYLTLDSITNGISTIRYGDNLVTTHDRYRTIRPVIMVKKST